MSNGYGYGHPDSYANSDSYGDTDSDALHGGFRWSGRPCTAARLGGVKRRRAGATLGYVAYYSRHHTK
jgi:hypothetical protein